MIYISFVPLTEKGVLKKIDYQIKALMNLGIKVNKLEILNNKLYILEKKIGYSFSKNNILHKIFRKISIINYLYNLKEKKIYIGKKNIYIRNFGSSPWSNFYFKFLKKNGVKIILEIPTYPYDKECSNLNIFFIIDKLFRKKLYKYVDKIVTYSEDKEIWGIPCINISNGIDLEEVQMVDKQEKDKNVIVFTSVSNCSFWHGIDRFLLSLEEYGQLDSKKEIKFNIVGEGSESTKLKEIVSKSEYLSKVVNFAGFKSGKDLDHIYDETSIAVGCLGNHRKGIYTIQALKNKEYMAKGLPMIFSE
ncbi:MAG: glycosyltransferase, partial [Fusobacteriaceae bacterium]